MKRVFTPTPEQRQEKRREDRESEKVQLEKDQERFESQQNKKLNIWPLSIIHFDPAQTRQFIVTFTEPFPVAEFVRRMEVAFKDIRRS